MSESEYIVRLPEHFFDKLHEGEIRASEFLTISILYKWANWTTGMVPRASAGGLETWSNNAYCADTFCKALQRLEQMGHITRLMVVGSNRDYPVMLHNYPKLGGDGKTELINQREVIPMKPMMISPEDARANRKSRKGRSEEAPEDAHEDTHEQTSDKVLSQSSLKSSLNNQSQVLSEPKVKSKEGKKERKETLAPLANVSAQSFENFVDHVDGSRMDEVGKLMVMMRKSWKSMEQWDKACDEASWVVAMARQREFNPYAMLLHNRSHHPPNDKKHGGLYLRSFLQWRVALESESQRALEDYQRCLETPCEICIRNKHIDWTKLHPFLGVDGIHCECPKPNLLASNYQCNACETVNRDMLLVPSKDRLKREWEEAETRRKEKLAKFDMRFATDEEIKSFKGLQGAGWVEGEVKRKTTRGANGEPSDWGFEEVHAALLLFLKHGQTVTWNEFEGTVETVRKLMTPIPNPEGAKGTAA